MTALLLDSALRVSLVTAITLLALGAPEGPVCRHAPLGAGIGHGVCAADARASAARAFVAGGGPGAIALHPRRWRPRDGSSPAGSRAGTRCAI